MPDIVVSEFMDESALAPMQARYDVLYDRTLVDRPADLAAAVADAKALVVRNRTQVRGALLEAAKNLKAVGRLGVGLDNIDLAACKARGIAVLPATGANDVSVAEYVICTAMMLLRKAYVGSATVAAGTWPRDAFTGREIAGCRMGLIGLGATARQVASRARALGMDVGAYDPHLDEAHPVWALRVATLQSLDAVIAESDVVSLHVPLTEATRHLIDAAAIARMKPGAILINAARGGVVDEAALVAALHSGHLGGAALDVFETEPLTAAAGKPFVDVGNLILTPHIAGITEQSNIRVSSVTVANVMAALEAS